MQLLKVARNLTVLRAELARTELGLSHSETGLTGSKLQKRRQSKRDLLMCRDFRTVSTPQSLFTCYL